MPRPDSPAAPVSEMSAYEIARSVVAFAEHEHPGNDWWGVQIALRHIEALIAEIDRLRTHNHEPVEGCHACASAEAMRRV